MTPENLVAPPPSSVPLRRGVPGRAQPPQDPAQRAKLQGAIAKAEGHVASIRASALAAVLSAVTSQSSTLSEERATISRSPTSACRQALQPEGEAPAFSKTLVFENQFE